MGNSSHKTLRSQSSELKWELDGRQTHTLFRLAREKAEEHIQKCRLRLIEWDRFDPQPQRYDLHSGAFGQFDNKSKAERISELERAIALYENVLRFCLKMESVVSQYEAEEFAKQMAQMFGRDRQ